MIFFHPPLGKSIFFSFTTCRVSRGIHSFPFLPQLGLRSSLQVLARMLIDQQAATNNLLTEQTRLFAQQMKDEADRLRGERENAMQQLSDIKDQMLKQKEKEVFLMENQLRLQRGEPALPMPAHLVETVGGGAGRAAAGRGATGAAAGSGAGAANTGPRVSVVTVKSEHAVGASWLASSMDTNPLDIANSPQLAAAKLPSDTPDFVRRGDSSSPGGQSANSLFPYGGSSEAVESRPRTGIADRLDRKFEGDEFPESPSMLNENNRGGSAAGEDSTAHQRRDSAPADKSAFLNESRMEQSMRGESRFVRPDGKLVHDGTPARPIGGGGGSPVGASSSLLPGVPAGESSEKENDRKTASIGPLVDQDADLLGMATPVGNLAPDDSLLDEVLPGGKAVLAEQSLAGHSKFVSVGGDAARARLQSAGTDASSVLVGRRLEGEILATGDSPISVVSGSAAGGESAAASSAVSGTSFSAKAPGSSSSVVPKLVGSSSLFPPAEEQTVLSDQPPLARTKIFEKAVRSGAEVGISSAPLERQPKHPKVAPSAKVRINAVPAISEQEVSHVKRAEQEQEDRIVPRRYLGGSAPSSSKTEKKTEKNAQPWSAQEDPPPGGQAPETGEEPTPRTKQTRHMQRLRQKASSMDDIMYDYSLPPEIAQDLNLPSRKNSFLQLAALSAKGTQNIINFL